jgi:hypothetical protein
MTQKGEERIRRIFDEAENMKANSSQESEQKETDNATKAGKGRKSSRPKIQIEPGKLPVMATTAESYLIKAHVPFYQRGSKLVRPIVEKTAAGDGRTTTTAALTEVDEIYLRDVLGREIEWEKYSRREKKWSPADAPRDTARFIIARTGERKFRPVAGLITTPTLRPNGSILRRTGYDRNTRLLLVKPPTLPPIPDKPSFDDALEALNVLDELLEEFPFSDNESRSVALSALITPVVRGALPVVPMHATRAPKAGTGKSYLFDIASAIAIGEPCPIIAAGRDEAETEKRLVAVALAGYPIINIDNVNGELAGDFLCQMIERPVVNLRVLGKSETVRVPNKLTTFCTGNNLRLTGDLPRRALLCSLDAKVERPEEREFKAKPTQRVIADRGKYVAAALTVVRAYIVAGKPGPQKPLASFEVWSDTVRSALVWLGRVDPVETLATVRAEDPQEQALAAVLIAWQDCFKIGPENAKKATEVIAETQEKMLNLGNDAVNDEKRAALRAAIEGISPRGKPDAKSLGKWLLNQKDLIVSGLRFCQVLHKGRASDWYVDQS